MKLSSMRRLRRNTIAVTGIGVLVAAGVGVLPAKAAVPFASAAFSGSATGEAVHLDALGRAVVVNVAESSSAVNSKGLGTAATSNTGTPINPAQSSKQSYARGAGLDVLGSQIAGLAESSAAPTSADNKEVGPVDLDPIAFASVARGTTKAAWNPESCLLGEDIARGTGYVADAQLVDTGADTNGNGLDVPLAAVDASQPGRNTVQTTSRQTLVPNADGTFGLRSQVAQTLVPITLAGGFTIEVAGDWVLSATATGIPGKSTVNWAPAGEVGVSTPVVRILQGTDVLGQLTLQDVLGGEGLDLGGVVVIATPPTQTISADGTSVVAAADVVRVQIPGVLDVRVGHSEVKATAPAGGINCPIPVTKKATPSIVNSTTAPDGKFQVAITIKNSFACDLINVSATDEISKKSGNVTFKIVEDDSRNDPKKGAGATFTSKGNTSATASYANLGTIPAGATKVLNVVVQVTGGGGEIQDIATAKGTLSCAEGSAIGKATINMAGSFTLVTTVSKVLARTGGEAGLALLFGGSAVVTAAARRIASRRRKTA